MSPPASGPGFPFEGDPDALRDAPLFREIQRVMSASGGPVNRELARQVGIATAVEAGDDPAPSAADLQGLEDIVRVAELHVAGLTGIDQPAEPTRVRAIRRSEWVTASTEGLGDLLEPAAERLGRAMTEAQDVLGPALPGAEDPDPELPGDAGMPGIPEMPGMAGMDAGGLLSQLTPLLMGVQTGQVLGALAAKVFAQYDVPVPRADASELLFVTANIAAFERDWSLEPADFRLAVALHEVTLRLALSRPWAWDQFRELLADFSSTLRIDAEGLRDKLASLETGGPEALEGLLGAEDGLFGADLDPEQRIGLGRIQAFLAAAQGYGRHVTETIVAEMLPGSAPRIVEALRRHRDDAAAEPLFQRLLGIETDRDLPDQGAAFCRTVVEQTDEATLARMWDEADAMPSVPEIAEPRLWLARTV